jgi:hypothetical protein
MLVILGTGVLTFLITNSMRIKYKADWFGSNSLMKNVRGFSFDHPRGLLGLIGFTMTSVIDA